MTAKSLCLLAPIVWLGFTSSFSAAAAGLDDSLVARWTFKDGSLTSDIGKFTFEEAGKGYTESSPETITVRERGYLVCPDINNQKFPELGRSVTIWARLKFDELPGDNVTNFLSLQTVSGPGSWSEMALSLLYRGPEPDISTTGLVFLARLTEGELGVGVSRIVPVTPGEFLKVAIVFEGDNGKASMWINGQMVSSELRGNLELTGFASLALGQLAVPGPPISITYDEVRIYSTVVDENWLAEIEPVTD